MDTNKKQILATLIAHTVIFGVFLASDAIRFVRRRLG